MTDNIQPTGSDPVGLPKWPFIALFSFLLGVASVLVYQKYLPATRLPAGQGSAPSPSSTARWQTYTNSNYSIEVQYPDRFNLNNELPADNYYETIGSFRSQDEETISISVIKDIDIYNQAKAVDVATREVMDSGYKYDVTETQINTYSAAITTINDPSISYLSVTIAHPIKNLFVVLILPKDLSKVEFDQILSTFKFID